MAVACVNVDLDPLAHYARIHGLSPSSLPEPAERAVGQVALERFLDLFAQVGVAATFFAVGEALEDPKSARALRSAAGAGHEVGNHSYSHDYALARRGPETIAREVERGEEAIARAIGKKPVGFRAPGYTLSAPLLATLVARGYRYDSSVFPSVPYYLAKAAVMGALAAARRPSKAVLDRPRVLAAPRLPYRPSVEEPYRAGAAPLVELPITVEPLTRLPYIGTLVAALPVAGARLLHRRLEGAPFLNFELHGIDLLDVSDVGAPALARQQRDLRLPVSEKRRRLRAALERIAGSFEVRTLEQAAAAFAA